MPGGDERLAGGDGGVWGLEEGAVRVAGRLLLSFRGLSKSQAAVLDRRESVGSPATHESEVPVTVLRAGEGMRADLVPWPEHDGLRWQTREGVLTIAGRHFLARVERTAKGLPEATVWTFWERPGEFSDAVTNFSRVLIALGYTSGSTMLLHSCATAASTGPAVLFFGPSGAGKSTIGSLSRAGGWRVLSDDLNAVEISSPGAIEIQGFPFSGDFGPRSFCGIASSRLGAIFKLEKSDRHEVVALRPAAALAGLAACSPFINAAPGLYGELLERLERLVARVPVYTLRFRRDEGFLEHVQRVVS